MRDRSFKGLDLRGLRGIEIGPLFRPLVEKDDAEIYYVDQCSTEDLKVKYTGDPNTDPDKIVGVDFVWKDKPLAETLGSICPVDYIVASHVVEHVPDLIGWLKEMRDGLRDGGLLILIVPDKRFTFDVCRRTSAYEEVRAAYREGRRRPGLRCIMDHFANVVQADCYSLWTDSSSTNELPFFHIPDYLSLAAEHFKEGRYVDVHCWVFTPWSFLELLAKVTQDEGLGFDLEHFETTNVNDLSFFVRLKRVAQPTTDWHREALRAESEALWPQRTKKDPSEVEASRTPSNEDTVKVGEFYVPVRLAALTGCSPETFESFGRAQFVSFQQHLQISASDAVVEIGCGAGRLAIPCTSVLKTGSYFGVDIIRDSIEWCSANITKRYPHFRFHFENVESQLHNPGGVIDPTTTKIPVPDASVDKIFLSSVFTHMFPDGVEHYLREFRRILKPTGVVLTTMFLLNEDSRTAIKEGKTNWSFSHPYQGSDICYIDSLEWPEGAVGYDEAGYVNLIRQHGMDLLKPIIYGVWSDATRVSDGQDYVVFGPGTTSL